MLDPDHPGERAGDAPTGGSGRFRDPSAVRALVRGITARCPRCGGRDLFAGWFRIRDRCPRCRLRLEREEGGFLGAMTINYTVTILVWLVLLGVWLALDLPEVHVLALTVSSLVLVGVFPLLFYRPSKTLWAAVDHLVDRSNPDFRSRDAADRASGNGGRY